MRVALYCPALTRIRGGIERLAADLSWAFDARGWSTIIYTHNRGDLSAVDPVYDLSPSARVVPVNFRDTREFGDELRASLVELSPDVICVMDVVPAFWHFIRATRGLNIPLVLSEHFAPSISETNFKSPLVRRQALSCADLIHMLTPSYVDTVDLDDRDRVNVIYNPIVAPSGRADAIGKPGERKRFVNAARIHFAQKAQDVLVSAFAKIANQLPDWDLVCVGNAHSEEEGRKFRDLVTSYGLGERVKWEGGLPHEELYEVLIRSQVFVLPSWFEGSPISLAEGLAHGLPAIGFEHCEGTNQMVRSGVNGLLAPGLGDADTLARTMLQLGQYPRLRAEYSDNAARLAEERAKPKLLEQWSGLIEEASIVNQARVSKIGTGELRYDAEIVARLEGEKILPDVKAISVPVKGRK